jgi:hypothetical protein
MNFRARRADIERVHGRHAAFAGLVLIVVDLAALTAAVQLFDF